jgi:O-acetyl-ADP-ribose deacetylase (regulator of RNase III)
MTVVFINYRVREQPAYATLLHRELTTRLGRGVAFLASDSIRAGDDFVRAVFENLRHCEVLLAVMGSRWLDTRGAEHGYGLGRNVDWVHREIAEAFAMGIRVIPVLTEDAEMPSEESLPSQIAALARCQCLRLRHYSIDSDLAQMIDELRRTVPSLSGEPADGFAASSEPRLFQPARDPASSCRIGVITGTIHRVRSADVWVNSENTDMEMARITEFSISAIIRYWGSVRDGGGRVIDDVIAAELAQRVGAGRPVAPGAVLATGSGELAASNNVRHILHVAAVHGEPGAGFRQVRDVGSCVANALDCCERMAAADSHVRTILFPLFGTGVAGGPIVATSRAMLLAMLDYVTGHPETALRAIYLLASTEAEYQAVSQVLRTVPLVPVVQSGGDRSLLDARESNVEE